MQIVKKVLKRIYFRVYIRRKNETKAVTYLSKILQKGLYYFPVSDNSIRKINLSALNPVNILHIHKMGISGGGVQYLEYGIGNGKILYFINGKAKGYYFSNKGFARAKNNFEQYYSELNYPCVSGIYFDESDNSITMEYIPGESYCDYYHDLLVVDLLIDCAVKSKIRCDNIGNKVYVQHGDAGRTNVIWTSDNSFVFIDLDNIRPYPPLLDVFHYLCCSNYKFDEIMNILKNSEPKIRRICEKCDFQNGIDIFDELFYRYCYHYRNMKSCYDDFKFLNLSNTSEYPKTHNLLLKLFGEQN